jgi:hypothetical protein
MSCDIPLIGEDLNNDMNHRMGSYTRRCAASRPRMRSSAFPYTTS